MIVSRKIRASRKQGVRQSLILFRSSTFAVFLAAAVLLSACQRNAPPAVQATSTPESTHTAAPVFTGTPLPAVIPSPTPHPTSMLAYTPEPVDLSAPVLMALSPRACEHTTALPPSQVFDHRSGPQAIITGGEVQDGPLTFGAWLYCAEKQPYDDQRLVATIRGLAFMFEWSGKNKLSTEQFKCYSGFDPEINPAGSGGYDDICYQTGGIGFGLYSPRGRTLDFSAAEIPFRYIFRALLPDGQEAGIVFSFALRRVNDGWMVVNAAFKPLTEADLSAALPTLAPLPPAPGGLTPIPQADLDQFVDHLLADINARRFDRLKNEMHSEFDLQFLPLGQQARGSEAAAQALEVGQLLARQPHIQWRRPSFRFSRYFPGKAPSSVHSLETTGWGLSQQDQGYITIGMEDGRLVWSGLLLYEDSYVNHIWLDSAPNPAGLIYQKDDQYFQVAADGNSHLLFGHEPAVGFNPQGEAALFGAAGQDEVVLYTFEPKNWRAIHIQLNGFLLWGVDETSWLNDHTLLIGLADTKEIALSQGGLGHLALWNVTNGKLENLPIEIGTYAHPATTPDGAILYNAANGALMQWRDGKIQPFNLGEVKLDGKIIRTVTSPVLSPDGTKLAGITSIQQGAENLPAYVAIDLAARTAQVLLTYHTIPTDARIPENITWSPDSRWLSIQSQDDDVIQNGVWLVSTDGQERVFLGTGTSDPVWLDDQKVVFSFVSEEITRLQQYNRSTKERSWLNLPAGGWTHSWGRGLPSVSAVQIGKVQKEAH